jgi:monoamine oxidase
MTVSTARIAIVGGGLAGLYASHLLEQRGIHDYVLLEARPTWGGRIESRSPDGLAPSSAALDRFDLGPTWFWPSFQPELEQLVADLGLERFPQFETGDMMLERSPNEKPMRTFGYTNSPASMRLVGGMTALVDALRSRLRAGTVVSGQTVQAVQRDGQHVEVLSVDATGADSTWRVERVLLAVPPRLAEQNITFSPALPATLARQWRHAATWMAPHAKYVAVYDAPFWREAGLSGVAQRTRAAG